MKHCDTYMVVQVMLMKHKMVRHDEVKGNKMRRMLGCEHRQKQIELGEASLISYLVVLRKTLTWWIRMIQVMERDSKKICNFLKKK